jgi:gamma-glutamyltranspeptidase/glutathione hydrolase
LDAPPLTRRWPLLLVASFLLATAGAGAPPAETARGMVAADHALASEAGTEIIRRGGNAVDAAVATALAAGVVQPSGSGLGGGGFAIVSGEDGVHVLDFRETAPAAASPAMFENGVSSRVGGASIATPGEGPGLATLVDRWGNLSRREVAAPALRLARRWFPAGAHLVKALDDLGTDRGPLEYLLFGRTRTGVLEGDPIRRTKLAHAIAAWADRGGRDFQQGWIAEDIVATAAAAGGILTAEDLSSWSPKERTPLVGTYRGWRVETFPPPSGGPVLLQMLRVLEGYDLASMDRASAAYFHLLAETMKHAYADRARFLGDPESTQIPLERLLSPARIAAIRSGFDPERTFDPDRYGMAAEAPDDHGTEHISVVVGKMAVGLTTTINLPFGSRVVASRSGILLNDEMDDFATTGDGPNRIVPGARPLSSMSPTVLTSADGRTRIAVGASGGKLIISAVLQVVLDVVEFGMDPAAAVAAPRIHHAWTPNVLKVERIAPESIQALRAKGHEVEETTFESSVQIVIEQDGGYRGASDPRRGGAPAIAR